MKNELSRKLQFFEGQMKNSFVLPFIFLIAMAIVVYFVCSNKISSGDVYIPAFLSMIVAITLPDHILQFLSRRGILKADFCQSKTAKAILAGLLAGAIILPAKWLFSPVSAMINPSQDKSLMLIVVATLFILIGLYATRKWWCPSPKELAEAVEKRDLMERLKAQGCSPGEILDRVNALDERRQWLKERSNNEERP